MSADRNDSARNAEAVRQVARARPSDQKRLEQLIRYSDLCSSAKEVAETLGDPFLAYMVSMSIQAARLEMRLKVDGVKT